jgi:hypothetical protein
MVSREKSIKRSMIGRADLRRNRNRGKSAQKRVAMLVGGKNVGSLSGEDVFHPDYSFEVKNLAKTVVQKLMAQAEKNTDRGRTPVVVVKLKGHHVESGWVIMRFKDWKEKVFNVKTL